MKCLAAFVIVGAVMAGPLRAGTTLEGIVELPSAPPAPTSASRYQPRTTRVGAVGAPVAVVYLEGKFPNSPTNAPPSVVMGQKNLRFIPRVLPVRRGTRVVFPNQDDEYHNVVSYSRAKEFDLGRYRKDENPPGVLFDKPGVVELDCEIHPHMRATILVLDTPYFTITDAEGRYRFESLPPGNYVLKAWIDYRTIRQAPVTLQENEERTIHFPAP